MWSLVPFSHAAGRQGQAQDRARSRAQDDAAHAGSPFLHGSGRVRADAPGADGRRPEARRARRARSGRRHHVSEVRRASTTQRESRRSTRDRSSTERRLAREAAFAVRPRLWAGTITDWSMYGEPYKQVLWDWPGIYERAKDAAAQPSEPSKGSGPPPASTKARRASSSRPSNSTR